MLDERGNGLMVYKEYVQSRDYTKLVCTTKSQIQDRVNLIEPHL